MIKRLIFDVDNTLIMWNEEFDYGNIKHSLQDMNLPDDKELVYKISKTVIEYETNHEYFDKEILSRYLTQNIGIELNINFINTWLNNQAKYAVPEKVEENLINTLEYLSKKYEMVIFTNWFGESQLNRLKAINIDKYFSKIYSAEKIKMKPNEEGFISSTGEYKPEECIMIGDSLEKDIEPAINVGINAILLDNHNKYSEENDKYKIIKDIKELKNIL